MCWSGGGKCYRLVHNRNVADHGELIERLRNRALDPDITNPVRALLNEAADALETHSKPVDLEFADPLDALVDDLAHP